MITFRCFKIGLLHNQEDIDFVESLKSKYPGKDIENCIAAWQSYENEERLPTEEEMERYFSNANVIPSVGQRKAFEGKSDIVEESVKKPINIWDGSNENADLSNFAERPFVLQKGNEAFDIVDEMNFDLVRFVPDPEDNTKTKEEKIIFHSVEQAFQYFKTFFSDGSVDLEDVADNILLETNGSKLKTLGKFKGLNSKEWDSVSSKIMKGLIKASFEQNPQALHRLLATGNATLTHTQEKSKWGKEFPRILMEVREELTEIYKDVIKTNNELIKDLGGDTNAQSEVEDAVKVAIKGVSFEEALANQKAIFTKKEQEQIKSALNGKNLRVMSVSRHTDPAFFSKEIISFLERNSHKEFYDPSRINAIEIWSKHDGLPIQDILDACKKYKVAPMMSFSITGLGGTALEGGVMKYNDLIDRIEKLIKSKSLNPSTTTIRIDPILIGVTNMEDIRKIVERCKNLGIKKFVTSMVQSYGYTEDTTFDRMVISGINNALASEGKTYDWDKYYGRRPDGRINFKPKQEYIDEIGKILLELDSDPDITIQTCAFGINGLKVSACLDPLIIERITGVDVTRKDGSYDRDTSRPECMCYGAHSDMFRKNEKKCFSSCAYCYDAHSVDNKLNYYNEDGTLKDNPYTKVKENKSEQEFYSGNANGSDKYWGEQARALGMQVKDYLKEDYDSLNEKWKGIIENEFQEVRKFLGRKELTPGTDVWKLVRRSMMQADKADAIFAIGHILQPEEIGKKGYANKTNHEVVDGGTGYAVARGIIRDIPVYVFDQSDNTWKKWDERKFVATEEPSLTPHAATIGTREIEENGKQAVRSILSKPIKNIESQTKQVSDSDYSFPIDKKTNINCSENLAIAVNNATVIWAHPTLGTTYMARKAQRSDIIDFESEFGKELGTQAEREKLKSEDQEQYEENMWDTFNKAKAIAEKSGKRLIVSDLFFLEQDGKYADYIDLFINMSNNAFLRKSALRGNKNVDSLMERKEKINQAMASVNENAYYSYNGNLIDIIPYKVPVPKKDKNPYESKAEFVENAVNIKELEKKIPSSRLRDSCVKKIAFVYSTLISSLQKNLSPERKTGSWAVDRRNVMKEHKGDIKNLMRSRISSMYLIEKNVENYLKSFLSFDSDEEFQRSKSVRMKVGQLLLDNFDELFLLAKEKILSYEPVQQLYDSEGNSSEDEMTKFEEGYFDDIHESSAESMVDAELRFMFSNILNLDVDGIPIDIDEIGDIVPMDFSVVSSTLRSITSNILSDEDMISSLVNNVKRHPWLQQVVDILLGKDTIGYSATQAHKIYSGLTDEEMKRKTLSLQARFWKDYHKYNVKLATQSFADGKVVCRVENREEGIDANLERYKVNAYNYAPMTDENGKAVPTLYNSDGTIDTSTHKRLSERFKEMGIYDALARSNKEFFGEDGKADISDEAITVIQDMLLSLGVKHDKELIKDVIESEDDKNRYKLAMILRQVFDTETMINRVKGTETIFSVLYKQYEALAEIFAIQGDSVEESSVFVNIDGEKKRLFSHIFPNHIHTIMGWISNRDGKSDEEYKKRLQEKFTSNWWFHNGGGKVRHAWLRDCINGKTSKDARRGYGQIKSVITYNETGYSSMTEYTSMVARLNEYFMGVLEKLTVIKGSLMFRDYATPTMADKNAFYFISGRIYENIEDVIEEYVQVVLQEADRIKMVLQRDEAIKNNENIKRADNWDITYDKDGKVKSYGGARFHFIKGLNNTPLLESLKTDPENQKETIKEYIKIELEKEFEQFIKFYNTTGATFIEDSPYNILSSKKGQSRKDLIEAIDIVIAAIKPDVDGSIILQSDISFVNYLNRFKEALTNEIFVANEESNLVENIDYLTQNLTLIIANTPAGSDFQKKAQRALDKIANSSIIEDNKDVREALQQFFYNDHFARTEIIQLTAIDPAFFNGNDDFQKRYAQFYTPYSPCYTSHKMYDENNNIIDVEDLTSKYDHYIILADEDLADGARSIGNINCLLDSLVKKNIISQKTAEHIIDSQTGIKLSDAQCYRTASSWIKVLNMTGRADDIRAQKLVEDLMSGDKSKYDSTDVYTLIEVIKSFVSSIIETDSHTSLDRYDKNSKTFVERNNTDKILVPTQHKDSEFILTAMFSVLNSKINESPKLKALNRFMEDHGIDKALFVSAVKDGCQGAIDINGFSTEEEVYSALEAATGLSTIANGDFMKASDAYNDDLEADDTSKGNRDVVHRTDMSNWGICTPMPEHLLSVSKSSISTQAMKIFQEDIPNGQTISVNGHELSKKQWIELYQKMFTHRIFKAFNEVYDTIKDTRQLADFLRKQITNNGKYPQDLLYYLELDENGEFKHPIIDPILNNEFDAMVSSLTRNRISKQKILNAALVQVTSFGVTDQLSLRFNDEDGNLILDESDFSTASDEQRNGYAKDQWEQYKKEYATLHSSSIAYMEIAIPLPRMEMMDALIGSDGKYIAEVCDKNGNLDYDKIKDVMNEKLRRGIGLRIPVEAKHSMCPVRIKFFLPTNNASCVMVPPEWIAMSDSDNDGDKLYTMLYEVESCFYFDKTATIKLLKLWNSDITYQEMFFNEFLRRLKKGKRSELPNGPEWDNAYDVARNLRKVKIEPVEFKMESLTQGKDESDSDFYVRSVLESMPYNSLEAINNLYIDMVTGVLSTDFNAGHMLTPGGFPEVIRVTSIMKALESVQDSEHSLNTIDNLKRLLAAKNEKEISKDGFNTDTSSYSISNPAMGVIYHIRNVTGRKLVPISANFRSFKSAIELANMGVKKNDYIVINGNKSLPDFDSKSVVRLCAQRNANGTYISDNLSEVSGSTVDNAKKSTMAYLGMTIVTAPWGATILDFGHEIYEMAFFLRQPIITKLLSLVNNKGMNVWSAISQLEKELEDRSPLVSEEKKKTLYNLDELRLAYNIANPNMENNDVVVSQMAVLEYLKKIIKWAKKLNDLNKACRGHTQNGSSKSDAYANAALISQVKDIVTSEKKVFVGENSLVWNIDAINPISAFDDVLNSPMPMETAFRYFVIESMQELHKDISMAYNEFVDSICSEIAKSGGYKTLPLNERKAVTEAVISYMMSRIPGLNLSLEGRSGVYRALPALISIIKNTKPNDSNNIQPLLENELISDLYVNAKGNSFNSHEPIMNISKVSRGKIGMEIYRTAWDELYDFGDTEFTYVSGGIEHKMSFNTLANYLFVYCFLVNGLSMTYNDFIQAFPKNRIDKIEGYVEAIKRLRFTDGSMNRANIIDQYLANNPMSVATKKIPLWKFMKAISSDDPQFLPDEIEVKRNDSSRSKEKQKTIQETLFKSSKDNNGEEYFRSIPFITINEKGDVIALYRGSETANGAMYQKIELLGNGNYLQEYQYNGMLSELGYGEEMHSIIPINTSRNFAEDSRMKVEKHIEAVAKSSDEARTSMAINLFGEGSEIKFDSYEPATKTLTGLKYCKKI